MLVKCADRFVLLQERDDDRAGRIRVERRGKLCKPRRWRQSFERLDFAPFHAVRKSIHEVDGNEPMEGRAVEVSAANELV